MDKIVLSTTALMLFGCGTSNHELTKKHLAALSGQLTDLRKAQAGMSVTIEDLETRLFLVQDELDTHRKRQATVRRQMHNLPVVRVQPQNGPVSNFDSNANTVAPRPDNGPLAFDTIDDNGNLVRGDGNESTRRARAAIDTKAVQPPPLKKADHDAVKLYKKSFEHLKKQRYTQAIEGFQTFIKKYPTHNYADNAVYWMGECYYDRALWMKALTTFQQVIQNYPMGNKAPDAMLKIGLSHLRLKNTSQARDVLKQVTEIYPRSPVARLAATKLEAIR